jgi:hypothetical protein
MMWRALRIIIIVVAVFVSPASAFANIITITYGGQIFGGNASAGDGTYCGTCSESGYDFTGQAFSLTYVFNTSAAISGSYVDNGTSSSLSGTGMTFVGYANASFGDFVPATCNVAGCSSSESDSAVAGSSYKQSVQWSYSGGVSTGASISTALFANPLLPGEITSPFALTGVDIGSGSFDTFFSPGAECGVSSCQSGDLQIESVSVTVETTPLPGALPLFTAGLGMIGLLSRRKRKPQIQRAAN